MITSGLPLALPYRISLNKIATSSTNKI